MGRKKVNRTPEEIKKRNRNKANRYYYKHRQQMIEKALKRYYGNEITLPVHLL
jgi:hypothetical protein